MLNGQVNEVGVDCDGVRDDTADPQQCSPLTMSAGEIERVESVRTVVIEVHHLICSRHDTTGVCSSQKAWEVSFVGATINVGGGALIEPRSLPCELY